MSQIIESRMNQIISLDRADPAETSLPDTSTFYRRMLESLTDGVYFVDLERRITYWNRGAEIISGYSAGEVVGHSCRDNLLMHVSAEGTLLCMEGCPLQSTLCDGIDRRADVFLRHRDGHRVPVSVRVSPMLDEEGRVIGAVETFSENSTQLALLEKVAAMEQLALTDPLTSLGNRRYTERVLQQQCELFSRTGDSFAVLFLDLDNFKVVNDVFGHEAGDAVLKVTARTILNNLRSYDFLGRWGGEEFIAVLPKAAVARTTAERCCSLVRSCQVECVGGRIHPTISIGAAVISEGESAEQVVRRADEKLLCAKQNGRDRVCGP